MDIQDSSDQDSLTKPLNNFTNVAHSLLSYLISQKASMSEIRDVSEALNVVGQYFTPEHLVQWGPFFSNVSYEFEDKKLIEEQINTIPWENRTIGKIFDVIRQTRGLSYAEVARKSNMSKTYIWHTFTEAPSTSTGKPHSISLITIISICDALTLPPNYLMSVVNYEAQRKILETSPESEEQ